MRSQFGGEEFFERNGQWGKREKIRPGVAKGVTDHGLGRTAIEFDGSEVVVGTMPADAAQADGQVNHQSLGDKTQLPVALIGGEFAANPLAVAFGFAVQVLVAAATAEGGHGLHPKVIGIGAQRMNGLLETDLDFESPAVEADDVQRAHGQIGAEENEPPPAGMNHPNKADQPTQRAPQQVAAVIEQLHPLLAIDRAGRLGKAGLEAEPVAQVGFAAIFLGASPAFGLGGSNGEEGDGVGADSSDQMMAELEEEAGELSGGIIGIGHDRDRLGPG